MNKIVLLLILTLLAGPSKAQVKPPFAIEEYQQNPNIYDDIRLFDLAEIKKRKIETVYIIYHPASWAEYHPTLNPCTCPYGDTLFFYRFDSEGRIIQYTYFQQLGDYSTTFHYDTLGSITARDMFRKIGAKKGTTTIPYTGSDSSTYKSVTINHKDGNDSLITEIVFLKFNHGLDTAKIITERYNLRGQLIEIQSTVNKRNAREYDDDTGESTYHYKYDYDDKGRLAYYRDVESNSYKKISYPFFGKLTEIYNASTDQLENREIKMVSEQGGIITVTTDRAQIILTPLEKGSKLYKLRTVVTPGEFPLMEYQEIIYK